MHHYKPDVLSIEYWRSVWARVVEFYFLEKQIELSDSLILVHFKL